MPEPEAKRQRGRRGNPPLPPPGRTSCGQCPHFGITSSRQFGSAAASLRLLKSGTRASFSPWMISTGIPEATSRSSADWGFSGASA